MQLSRFSQKVNSTIFSDTNIVAALRTMVKVGMYREGILCESSQCEYFLNKNGSLVNFQSSLAHVLPSSNLHEWRI